MSHIRGFCRNHSPNAYESLAPRIMVIPDDPLGTSSGDGQIGGPWSVNNSRLLKAVDDQSFEGLQTLLSLGATVNAHGGAFHETPLHKAAQQGWVEGLQLLLSHGATVFATNQFGQTPLHYAAASKSCDCIRKLLDAGSHSALDHRDMRGHTPLHDSAAVGHPEGVIQLLKAGASVDLRDKNEETPLHKAAKARCISSMLALLNKGADMGARDKTGESVLSYALRHIPSGMDALFDHCLITNADKLTSKKLEVAFNFVPLAGTSQVNQMKTLNDIVDLGQPKLLLHPLCEAFLLLKWHNVRKLFFIEVIFYFTHAILATLLILDKFVWQVVEGTTPERIPSKAFRGLLIVLLLQAILILLKQILTIIQGVRTWIFSLWHVLNGVIPVLVLMVLPGNRTFWQHHLATITILLIWVQCMLHIGRFPGCGIYVSMFTRVAKVFLRIFLIFFCLLLSFSLSFYIGKYGGCYESDMDTSTYNCSEVEQNEMIVRDKVYSNPVTTFIKTLTMMIGELDFDSDFVEQLRKLPGTSHIIYLAFVILVSIILSNLLVALAVHDVQGLRNSAHLERLIKQMELVFQMDKTFSTVSYFASLVRCYWLASKVKSFVHDFTTIKVFMQPYNPQKGSKLLLMETGILKEISLRQSHVNNMMECLRLREEEVTSQRRLSINRPKSRKVRSEYSSSGIGQDDMRDSLKQLERNVQELLNERLDDFTLSFSALSTRIRNLESALVNAGVCAFSDVPSRRGSEYRGGGVAVAVGEQQQHLSPPPQNGPASLNPPGKHLSFRTPPTVQRSENRPPSQAWPKLRADEDAEPIGRRQSQLSENLQPTEGEYKVEIEMGERSEREPSEYANEKT